jgi:very-short-patch-repair endonuclease
VRLEMIARARGLRKAATEAEQVLWERLRDRQLSGLKFRRQHPIGPFIVDFFCGEVGLVVEIDGPIHEEPSRRVYDAWREAFLRAYGLRVVRFTNKEVLSQIEGVLEGIERAVRPSPPSPLSQGERGSPSPPAPLPEGEGSVYLPLYEAKMVWVYQHRHGTYEGVSGRTSTQLPTPRVQRLADPTFLVQPWYWVPKAEVEKRLETWVRPWLIAYRNITSATNERSAVFTLTAVVGFGHSANLLLPEAGGVKAVLLIANMAALPFDWIVRQKLAGLHLSAYYLKQLPVLPPEAYRAEAVAYVVPRVVELVYVAWDMKGFADEVWAEAAEEVRELIRERWEASWGGVVPSCEPPDWLELYRGSRTGGCPLSPFCWDVERRARVQAELDVYYARLYGLSRKQLRYMLDPADLTLRELEDILDPWEEVRDPLDPEGYAQRVRASKFPGESFRVLKEKELREYGEYRTRRLILEAWG